MLSYQHYFHAANHADLLKHACLCALLEKLLQKPKPFFCLDTHSGNGVYALQQHKQDENEVEKYFDVQTSLSSFVAYLNIAKKFNQSQLYPGSAALIPLFIEQGIDQIVNVSECKKQEILSACQIHLNELHPSAFESLKSEMKHQNVHIHNRNGFELLNALMPPTPNRGLVLIDPPYEQTSEYKQVLASLVSAQRKWPQGTFALWYPLLSPQRINRKSQDIESNPKYGLSENLITQLVDNLDTGIVNIKWAKFEPSSKVGMYGSGMLIINPPYKIEEQFDALSDMLLTDASEGCRKLSTVEVLKASK